MGAGQSSEAIDPQTTQQLQALAQKYATTLKQISQLEQVQTSQVTNLKGQQNNLQKKRNALDKEKDEFRLKINALIQEYQKKVNSQTARNKDLNVREQNVSRKMAEIETRLAQNAQTFEQRKAAEIEAAKKELEIYKQQQEEKIKSELAPLAQEMNAKKQELNSIRVNTNARAKSLQDLNAQIATKSQQMQNMNAQIATKSQQTQNLNRNISGKQTGLSELEAEYVKKSAELQAAYDLNTQQKIEQLQVTLDGIKDQQMADLNRQKEEAAAEIAAEKLTFQQALLAERQAFEAEQQRKLEEDLAQIRAERGELDAKKLEAESKIRELETAAQTSQQAAQELAKQKEELAGLQAEQAALEKEKKAIEEEKLQSAQAIAEAKAEAEKARQEKIAAEQDLQKAILAQQKAEAVENYRKQVFQVLKDWIEPLKLKKQIITYHDDETDDYFFQKGTERKPWVAQKTIEELGLTWQPRPEKPAILTQTGGKRKIYRKRNTKGKGKGTGRKTTTRRHK